MAEAIARDRLGTAATVASAGTRGLTGRQATPEAVTAAREAGVDLSGHSARRLDAAMLDAADHVYVMTRSHLEDIRSAFGDVPAHVELLHPDGYDIVDPYGEPLTAYRQARDRIEEAITARVPEWS